MTPTFWFVVNCDLGCRQITEDEVSEWVEDSDSRVFRTDGTVTEASFVDVGGNVTWQPVNFNSKL